MWRLNQLALHRVIWKTYYFSCFSWASLRSMLSCLLPIASAGGGSKVATGATNSYCLKHTFSSSKRTIAGKEDAGESPRPWDLRQKDACASRRQAPPSSGEHWSGGIPPQLCSRGSGREQNAAEDHLDGCDAAPQPHALLPRGNFWLC